MAILLKCCKFYNKLYTSQNIENQNIETYLSNINTPKLDLHDKNLCDAEICEKEVYEVVKTLNHHKSPSLHGIVPEFYQNFLALSSDPL